MSSKQTIHIISDGDPEHAIITNSSGQPISERVLAFRIEGEARQPIAASLEVWGATFDVDATVEEIELVCPCCQTRITHHCGDDEVDDRRLRHSGPDLPF